jgi:hypothetical protein
MHAFLSLFPCFTFLAFIGCNICPVSRAARRFPVYNYALKKNALEDHLGSLKDPRSGMRNGISIHPCLTWCIWRRFELGSLPQYHPRIRGSLIKEYHEPNVMWYDLSGCVWSFRFDSCTVHFWFWFWFLSVFITTFFFLSFLVVLAVVGVLFWIDWMGYADETNISMIFMSYFLGLVSKFSMCYYYLIVRLLGSEGWCGH